MALALHNTFNDKISNENTQSVPHAHLVDSAFHFSALNSSALNSSVLNSSTLSSGFSQQTNNSHCESEAFPGELAQLRRQSQQHEQLIDVMPTGMIMLDGNGVVIKVNKMACQLLDEPILGQPWFDVIQRSFKPREDDWHEVSLKDGRRVKLEISPLGSQPGQLIVITDLTETRLLQDKLGQLQRLSSLGRMVSTLAHQIRTPLSAAMLYSANLGNSNLPESSKKSFQEKLCARLRDLEQQVNDMLLFSKSGTEQVVAPLDVNKLIADSVQSMEPLIHKANMQLNVQLSEQSCDVLGNKNALTGAIQNLIHNALNALSKNTLSKNTLSKNALSKNALNNNPSSINTLNNETVNSGKINIQVYRHLKNVYISVKDNGKGIDKKMADKIFEPFYTSTIQGTGLGLAVVKSVVNAHQGKVSLLDDGSQGAHFCITLPLFEPSVKSNEQEHNHEHA